VAVRIEVTPNGRIEGTSNVLTWEDAESIRQARILWPSGAEGQRRHCFAMEHRANMTSNLLHVLSPKKAVHNFQRAF
jgi:hypothetical protein